MIHHRDTEDTEKGLNRLLFRDRSPKKSPQRHGGHGERNLFSLEGRWLPGKRMPLGNGEGWYGGQGKDSGQGSVVTGRTPQ